MPPWEKYGGGGGGAKPKPWERYAAPQPEINARATGKVSGDMPYVQGLGASLAQGFMGGLADEAAGVAADAGLGVGPLSVASMVGQIAGLPNERSDTARDQFRAVEREFAAENPLTALAANIGGGILSGGAIAKAAPTILAPVAATRGGNIARGAASGAGAAGVTGFAAGEGGAGNRLESAAWAAPTGLVLGAAAPIAVSTFRGMVNAGARPARITGTPQDSADAYLANQMARDGMDPAAMRAQIDANPGKPMTMADLGGENTLAALDMAVNRPGPARSIAREFFRRRQTGKEGGVGAAVVTGKSQAERLAGDVRGNVADANFYDSIDTLAAKRSKEATPLYEAAYEGPGYVSPSILGLLRTPAGQSALKKARDIAANEVGADSPEMVAPLLKELDAIVSPDGSPIPMRVLDMVKRGLDDVVEGAKDPMTRRIATNEGRAANSVLARFRNELVTLNPKYGEALAAWSGPTRAMGTIEDGRDAMVSAMQPEQVAKAFAKLSPNEQELYKIGVARALHEKIGRVAQETHDASKRVLTGTEAQKLAAILPREKAIGLIKAIEQERAMYATTNVMGGSPTARRLANEVDADSFEKMMADGVSGQRSLRELALSGIRWVRERGSGIGDEKVRERITRALLSDNPQAQRAALDRIEKQIAAKASAVQQGAGFASAQGLALGSSVGNFIGGR